jgi:hypothetical protein
MTAGTRAREALTRRAGSTHRHVHTLAAHTDTFTQRCCRYCAEEVIDVGRVMPRCSTACHRIAFYCGFTAVFFQGQHDRGGHRRNSVPLPPPSTSDVTISVGINEARLVVMC